MLESKLIDFDLPHMISYDLPHMIHIILKNTEFASCYITRSVSF